MKYKRNKLPILIAAAFVGTVLAFSNNVLADNDYSYRSNLSSTTTLTSAQEVQDPAVISNGIARASISFDSGFTRARVNVRYRHLVGSVTRLHLHCAVAGQNGQVAIGIIDSVAAGVPGIDNSDKFTVSGNRIRGTLTNEEFPANTCIDSVGQPINNIVSLAAAIDAGLIYWNLHTDAFPAGELRGQARATND